MPNPITGDEDYFDPMDPAVISGSEDQTAIDQQAMAPDQSWNAFDMAPMNAPAVQQDPAQNFNQAVLGGRQDNQKDAAANNDYASAAMQQMMMSMNPAANPFGTGTGKSGLGALDPRLKVQQSIMTQSQPMGRGWTTPVAKALAGFNMSNTIGNQQQAMGAQNAQLAQIYGSNLPPMQKALLAARMGDKTMAAQFAGQARMGMSQQNQDRRFGLANDKEQRKLSIAEDVSNAIAQGKQSPMLTGMYGAGPYVRQALAKKGVDLYALQNDFVANQAYFKNINSTQQIRLKQALTSVKSSVPELRRLNNEFKRSGWTPANAMELKLAMTGTDPRKRDLATKFVTQINLMRDELAQGFMAGGQPTDKALDMSNEVIDKFYGAQQLSAGLDQLEINLAIREKAISEVTPMGFGGSITPPSGGSVRPEQRTVVRTGRNKKTGKKVTEYSDGTREEV